MKKIILYHHKLKHISTGHPWVYTSQIKEVCPTVEAGQLVQVVSDKSKFIGIGFYNPKSKIPVRILTPNDEAITREFWQKRILNAIAWRNKYISNTNARRIINSESDGLPGLIVDQYDKHLVIQILTLGMEMQKNLIQNTLLDLLKTISIYERNDMPSRTLEGLPISKHQAFGCTPERICICENGAQFWVDVITGHKTGFYLDQRDNRKLTAQLAQDKKVLDVFCYTGAFSIHAMKNHAKHVTAIDISEPAIKLMRDNIILNNIGQEVQLITDNGFDLLKNLSRKNEQYDLIILDPPSFTRRRDNIQKALSGYKEINLRAMKMLEPGGTLITASCSHHIHKDLFQKSIIAASLDAKRRLKQLHLGTQALDHPIAAHIPETEYLKCFFYEVC